MNAIEFRRIHSTPYRFVLIDLLQAWT